MENITLEDIRELKEVFDDFARNNPNPLLLPFHVSFGVKIRETLLNYEEAGEVDQKEARAMFRVIYHIMGDDRENDYLPEDEESSEKEDKPDKSDIEIVPEEPREYEDLTQY